MSAEAENKSLTKTGKEAAENPFAERSGKDLTWSNVDMKLEPRGKDKVGKDILSQVWGEVPKREITAIMGPSGSGKTSLLNILAGRLATNNNLTINSDVRLNNYAVNPTALEVRKQIAFVAQDDSLQATSTPREAIKFSAKLRLPRSTTEEELDRLTDRMLEELGLTHCADTFVGGALLKGISGGERKRTSVGVELVVKPSLVFLDEPTSGLDSFSAVQLVQVLHKVANAGSSVLFTIHQPSSEVFNSFDHLILLNHGKVMYQGPVSNIPQYFEDRGHAIPANYNPADWIMTVAQKYSVEELTKDGFFEADNRDLGLPLNANEVDGVDALGNSKHETIDLRKNSATDGLDKKKVSFWTQVGLLFNREIKNMKRDKASLGARFGITIFLNILFGVIFLDVGKTDNSDQDNIRSHFGSLIMVLLSTMFGTAQPALFAIPEERPIFLREYSTDHYSVIAYFVSRLTIEAVITFVQVLVQNAISYNLIGFQANFFLYHIITYVLAMASTAVAVCLGCAVDDAKMAQELLPLLFVPQMLFAGFFVSIDLLPSFLRWVQYICSLTYGLRLVLIAEFQDCADNDEGQAQINCENLLVNQKSDADDQWWFWLVLAGLFVVLRLTALVVLKGKASSFY